ncbi:YhcH/YjgK/YiaL family protein [uncultured Draconibacterium sp.]|uniref:YhcH/YjgK/YiaL family protein n=1 Tax=uncultured Draconibacterium sp. TaxID=1573823 RepID=UPI0025DEF3A9|nr:YhcH/YjgK/YiaL family protein [uncultured Draconibacterium sp.]
MISDTLNKAALYNTLHPLFKKSFDFLSGLDPEIENGSYEIEPGLIAHVSSYQTGPTFEFGWETHQKYIDIQYCLKGEERIEWTPLSDALVPSMEYDEEKDRRFFTGEGRQTYIALSKSVFAIFFPNDAHAPQIMFDEPQKVKKVVIKVPV